MTGRRAPRGLESALGALRESVAPQTPLAAVQAAWPTAVGERIAAVARPVAEAGGELTVECESAVWAEQLNLMSREIIAKLEASAALSEPIRAIRFKTGRH